jgi:hypothetical protein
MLNAIIIFLGIFLLVLIFLVVQLFRMPLNDFLEKTVAKTVWLWLPFHAFKRLSKEYRERK